MRAGAACVPEEDAVIDGYVRLSRDDNRKHYTSIENQKRILRKFAEENHMKLRTIYEDDGFSGYSFDRPAFREMMEHLDTIKIIAAKDLSRIGRHNAGVLLFLEQMEALGIRVILIDDNYDSACSDDDIIGIKTWDNERHVKNTSRKVRRVKRLEQENGTLVSSPPFGYIRKPGSRKDIVIDEEAAAILRLELELYLEGNGIRKIAEILTDRNVPTPSMLKKERMEAMGLPFRSQVTESWSCGMVRDTLFNDYHNGVFRTHKRERISINGSDRRVPPENQFLFTDHHPKLFDDDTMKLLSDTRRQRYRSSCRQSGKIRGLFSGLLICRDCRNRMTAICRPGKQPYYVCGTYNKKGTAFCSCSHRIEESVLLEALCTGLSVCVEQMPDHILPAAIPESFPSVYGPSDSKNRLQRQSALLKEELKQLICTKVREMASNPSMKELIAESYGAVEKEKRKLLMDLERELKSCASSDMTSEKILPEVSAGSPDTPAGMLRDLFRKRLLTRADVAELVEQVVVDRYGNALICLRCRFEFTPPQKRIRLFPEQPSLPALDTAVRILKESHEEFISPGSLSRMLTKSGHPLYRKKAEEYLEQMTAMGITEKTGTYHRPYRVLSRIPEPDRNM